MRILVVDDSFFMRNYLMKMLSEARYTDFLEAENGLKAIELYEQYRPNLIIMDLNMPVLDGLGALKEIMNINPLASVLICTSMGGQKWIVDELMEFGAQQVIEKPYFTDLVSAVNRLADEQAKVLSPVSPPLNFEAGNSFY
ncbi:response regulator [Ureibacillus sinduriensis]|uniref:response regulator n=1 Tax=Ureibacillus sinduriensis TaxID=561440 RepID=UPI0009FE037A|nr:response regulator [Ureibacillus sinduriensis]